MADESVAQNTVGETAPDSDPAWLKGLVEGLGFVYWPGGREPPADYDGGPTLNRDPRRWNGGPLWHRMPGSPDRDIIGYRRKVSETARNWQ